MRTAKTPDFGNARFWMAATSPAAKIQGWLKCLKRGCDSNEAFARSVQPAFFQPCGRRSLCGPENEVSRENFSAVESYAILHHFNYPATFDYRYLALV